MQKGRGLHLVCEMKSLARTCALPLFLLLFADCVRELGYAVTVARREHADEHSNETEAAALELQVVI